MSTTAEYYKLDIGNLPDELFHPDVPVEKWLARATTAGKAGFPKGSLNVLSEIPWDVEVERLVGISLYMAANVLPFLFPMLFVSSIFSSSARHVVGFLLAYVSILCIFIFLFRYYFVSVHRKRSGPSAAGLEITDNIRNDQYLYTERNTTKYLSVNFVWPKSMHPPKMQDSPLIFSLIPHGVAPSGISAYPVWSKLWNGKICHWTVAPAVLKIPIIRYYLHKMGYIPAKSQNIHETLTTKKENVGIALDGIAGMFQSHVNEETAYLKSRKGVIKVAMRAGAKIVPVYGFGHTALWTVVVDPFGLLEKLSNHLGVSLTPFFGRWGWFLGPPRRIPVTMCLVSTSELCCCHGDGRTLEPSLSLLTLLSFLYLLFSSVVSCRVNRSLALG
jgi:hypothetical protein